MPAKVVWLSDHRITLPPLPRSVAEALMVVPASTLTVVAVGMAKLSSFALWLLTRLVVGLAAAPVAADQHLAAAGAAGDVDHRAGELDVLAGDQDGAALGALVACPPPRACRRS